MKDEKGFTFIELLVSMAILSIVSMLIYTILFTGLNFYRKAEPRSNIIQNGRYAIDTITRDIKMADKIIKINVTPNRYKENFGFLITKKEELNGNILYKHILYYKDGNKIRRGTVRVNKGTITYLAGHNELAEYITDIDGKIKEVNGRYIAKIIIKVNSPNAKEETFTNEVMITCPVE